MKILKTNDLDNAYLKILSYGQPGSGKTMFSGSMEFRFKTLIVSAESGLLSLRNLKGADGTPINIDYTTVAKYEDLESIYHTLKNTDHGYQAVAIDSLTEIQKTCRDHIMGGKEAMEIRDWGTLGHKMERMVRAFRDLPMHFVTTAIEETETDKISGEVRVMPALQGSLQKTIAAYFDEVFYHYSKEVEEGETKKIKHFILTRNSGKYLGKDRSGKLPAIIADPDFGKVFDYIFQPKN